MRKIGILLLLCFCTIVCKAQIPASGKVSQEKMLERFLSYVKIEGQSYARGGTTSAMMVARFPDVMLGGSDFYSEQNAEHS